MDNVGIVVNDLRAAIAFFGELGMELVGETTVTGDWVDRVLGLNGVESEIAMMRTPDDHIRLELSKFKAPQATTPNLKYEQINTLGKHRIMFAVDDIKDTVARLHAHGAELVGEIVQYRDMYLLCYLRANRRLKKADIAEKFFAIIQHLLEMATHFLRNGRWN